MRQAVVLIENEIGLHARPAALFVQRANSYQSKITVENDGKVVNAKSILSVLSLGAEQGAKIKIVAEGPDEEEAICGLVELIKSKFGQDSD